MWIATYRLPTACAALIADWLEDLAELIELRPDGAHTDLALWSAVRPEPALVAARLAPLCHELGIVLPRPRIAPAPAAVGLEDLPPARVGRFVLGAGKPGLGPGPGRLCFADPYAFGLGDHPTTRLCLALLPRLVRRGRQRIADIGTGTGILALAALRLRRRRLCAGDCQAGAVIAARRNAAANHLGPWLRVVRADGARHRAFARPQDLILANLLPQPLLALAPSLCRALAPGGRLLISGLTGRQQRRILARYRRLRLCAVRALAGWRALVLEKPVAGRRRSL